MGVYNLSNIILIVLLVGFSAYYLWDWFRGNHRKAVAWVEANKKGQVPEPVQKAYAAYPDKERFLVFWLQIQQLEKRQLKGDFAELGVYRGETAALLRALAPDRELHLFDTFCGFRQDDLVNESGEAASYTPANFADTSVSFVQNRLGYSNKIHYHEGNFKEVSEKLTEMQYALVSIDVDLQKPTADGLAYFYPRLQPGGVLIIHDYNPKWPGLMEAVDAFLHSIPESAAFMPDMNGSVVIVKNKG